MGMIVSQCASVKAGQSSRGSSMIPIGANNAAIALHISLSITHSFPITVLTSFPHPTPCLSFCACFYLATLSETLVPHTSKVFLPSIFSYDHSLPSPPLRSPLFHLIFPFPFFLVPPRRAVVCRVGVQAWWCVGLRLLVFTSTCRE